MTATFVKLTNAKKSAQLALGQNIHINLHRVQAVWRLQNEDMTRIEMNILDPKTNQALTYYVTEMPADIYKDA